MMRQFLLLAAAAGICAAAPAAAQSRQGVVVELYTSQGCSSCPPADAYLAQLAGQSDVIPLALHVDYWDYIGWEDTFGQAKFADRQRAYAHAAGRNMIFTPQMIVAGGESVAGNAQQAVAAAIKRAKAATGDVVLRLERQGDEVRIHAETAAAFAQGTWVQLVRYSPSETVEIRRGENAGRTISYTNIVTSWSSIGTWDGSAPLEMSAQAPGSAPLVVIIQAEGAMEIVAAAQLK